MKSKPVTQIQPVTSEQAIREYELKTRNQKEEILHFLVCDVNEALEKGCRLFHPPIEDEDIDRHYFLMRAYEDKEMEKLIGSMDFFDWLYDQLKLLYEPFGWEVEMVREKYCFGFLHRRCIKFLEKEIKR